MAEFLSRPLKLTTGARTRVRRAVCAALVTCTLVLTSWLLLANREPRFEGKPFSFWLEQIPITEVIPNGVSIQLPWIYNTRADATERIDKEKSDKALNVVNQIGGQCMPMLLRRLKTRDSAFKTRLVQWLVLHHLFSPSRIPRNSDMVRGQALTAIIKLDYSAKPIFPDLELLAQDRDPQIGASARLALECLNPGEFSR
jgi:hypothetical protein